MEGEASAAIVTSGETSDEAGGSDDPHENRLLPNHHASSDDDEDAPAYTGPDELYDEQADKEDEAYVYKHLRSGLLEEPQTTTSTSSSQHPPQHLPVPRNSDAILSCPCCLRIVCMDCQRHERFKNQYRAMFVMNIAVRWDETMMYDEMAKGLVSTSSDTSSSVTYYTVCCAYCETTVAALDMTDEVYHFYGCLASA